MSKMHFWTVISTEKVYIQFSPRDDHPPRKIICIQLLIGLSKHIIIGSPKLVSSWLFSNFSCSVFNYVFFLHNTNQGTIVFLLHLNDIILIGDDSQGIQELKMILNKLLKWMMLAFQLFFSTWNINLIK